MTLVADGGTTAAPVAVEDVVEVVLSVWRSFAPESYEPWADEAAVVDPREAGAMSGSITVTGDWTGVVTLACSAGAAARWARVMLMLPEDEVPASEDVYDTISELVNVVGGNIKALCAQGGQLGLPVVAEGAVLQVAGSEQMRVVVAWPDVPEDVLEVRMFVA